MNPWGCLFELPHFSVPPGNGRGDLRGLLQSAARQGLQQLLSSGRLAYRGWPLGAAGTRGPRLLGPNRSTHVRSDARRGVTRGSPRELGAV